MEKLLKYTKNRDIVSNTPSAGTGKCEMNGFKGSWLKDCENFYNKIELHGYDHYRASGCALYGHIASCEYTDEIIELKVNKFEIENQELKLSISSLVKESYLKNQTTLSENQERKSENQELRSLIYDMMD